MMLAAGPNSLGALFPSTKVMPSDDGRDRDSPFRRANSRPGGTFWRAGWPRAKLATNGMRR